MKRVLRDSTYVECMAKVGHSDSDNFSVAVNPDTNRSGECYLKYYNHKRYRSADKVVRVSLTEPKYVFHRNYDGKATWDLSTKDKEKLVNFLNSKSSFSVTNWQLALYYWNNESDFLGSDTGSYDNPVEAFVNGYYDTKDNLSNPSYVPSYTEMPNYMELK